MAVRNCREIGENLQKIMTRLMANDDLVKLLYYTDQDPLSQPNLTQEQKKKLIFNKLIKIIPRVGPKETASSIITLRVVKGRQLDDNDQFKNIVLSLEIFVPLTQWIFKDTNLRPFAILGEIQESLNNKTIGGIGKLKGGDFDLRLLTDEMSCYEQTFNIIDYD